MVDPMPGDPRMRASDADRERAATLLREHHAAGRLTTDEFGERVEQVFAAKTLGELDTVLADLPAIDLYQLPDAGIERARSRRPGGSGLARRGDGTLSPRQIATWLTWTAASAMLLLVWLGVGIAAGGAAWLPWFLLIVIPWAQTIARHPPNHL
jgi:hypothetical protein